MSDIRKLTERYHNDSTFHNLVKNLENIIETLKLSPYEVREAAMFACYLTELRNPMPKQYFEGPK